MKTYPFAKFPVFENYNHMEFQIRNPKDFANSFLYIIKK